MNEAHILDPPIFTFYRITWHNPPHIDDMKSNEALGKQPRGDDPEVRRLWGGISLFDSIERARSQARRRPWHGNAFIAEVQIPEGMFRIEATRSRGHFTLWGDPRAILRCVHIVEHV